jgi:hypothetical protein
MGAKLPARLCRRAALATRGCVGAQVSASGCQLKALDAILSELLSGKRL